MRTTLSGYFRNQQIDQNKAARELFDVTKQISSGQKIKYAYDSPSTFIDTVRLDNEITTLTQVKQTALSGLQVSTNTDTTMNEMTKILDAMKVKLVNAANETNTQESLNAIAAELRGLENNLIQLANTSINGNYIFSGSEIKTKPIDANGVYQGNGEDLKAFIGSGVQQTYNINGQDLFLGDENAIQRKITLNIPLFNQTKLYPDVMIDKNISRNTAEEEYITERHTIRDLMGDKDELINDVDLQHHFYIQGTRHDGSVFKETVSMRDDESVGGLLERIGQAFGNLQNSQLVTVSINHDGQIEIEDNRPGSSKLDFHMVANTDIAGPVTDIEQLNTNQTLVKSFIKSDYTEFVKNIGQRQDLYDKNIFELSGDFITQDGKKATGATLLSDVLRADMFDADGGSIDFTRGGTALDTAGGAVPFAGLGYFDVTATSTMQDLMDEIKLAYDAKTSGSNDIVVSLKDGRINIRHVEQPGSNYLMDIGLTSYDTAGGLGGGGQVINGLPADATVAFDESEFKKEANSLLGNVSQIVTSDNSYATLNTKLSEVASRSLNGKQLIFEGIDINGNAFEATIDFNTAPAGATFSLDNGVTNYAIYNMGQNPTAPITATNPQVAVPADEMTYKQLTDVMNMIVTSQLPLAPIFDAATGLANGYNDAIKRAEDFAQTTLSYDGKIEFKQSNTTLTKASFKLADANASDFSDQDVVTPGVQTAPSLLTFHSNNALEISDPKTNFFKQIDEIISSIEAGRLRADGTLDDPRNVGVQNSIQAIDDLSEHLFNQHSIAGVQSQTLQVTKDRTDLLIITTQTLRSDTIDVDFAEAALRLKQVELNYQAMLSTVSKISQLSLVNYL